MCEQDRTIENGEGGGCAHRRLREIADGVRWCLICGSVNEANTWEACAVFGEWQRCREMLLAAERRPVGRAKSVTSLVTTEQITTIRRLCEALRINHHQECSRIYGVPLEEISIDAGAQLILNLKARLAQRQAS